MPVRLRPTAPTAADALLVGDPGRALLLAQELLDTPKMSNHARGLWGYTGEALVGGGPLTIQATGMGGPSAAIVLGDLAELGVQRIVRVGSCAALPGGPAPGGLLHVSTALAYDGAARSLGAAEGEPISPDRELAAALDAALDDAATGAIASFDVLAGHPSVAAGGAIGADMQTAALLTGARNLGVAAAAVLIVETPSAEEMEAATKKAGAAASRALST